MLSTIFKDYVTYMKIIAKIHTDFKEKFGIPRQSGIANELVGKIVFEPEYRRKEAFIGIEGYSHLWIIWQFSEAIREVWSPTVRPPRLGGNKRVGVFATRSPYRPNPIGLSSVRLEKIEFTEAEGPVLYVRGADILDGTPIDGFPMTHEYPGVFDFIRKLRSSGAKTYIATNKRYIGTLKMVAKFGWGSLFDGVYSGDMYMDDPSIGKMRKPELLKFIMQKEKISPEQVVMVGDTENDFEAARENSIESIGVKWGYGNESHKPDRWVRSAEELFSLVF